MPSTQLVGLNTPCNWKVVEKINSNGGSGGNFCIQYIVENTEGRRAFLKAMDLKSVASKSLKEMNEEVNKYLFEQTILNHCREKKLKNVVVPLSHGELVVAGFLSPLDRVFYIIFELASGNLREQYINRTDFSWVLYFKAMQNVCQGVEQLHRTGIAHQDIKPSNVLHFSDDVSKIGDLGRVTDIKGNSPFSGDNFTGDWTYAPVESHFGFIVREFSDRYLTDIYEVGSLVYNTIMGTSITHAVFSEAQKIDMNFQAKGYETSLPTLYSAFTTVIDRMSEESRKMFGDNPAAELSIVVHEMCHPNIELRGSPKFKKKVLRLNMQRYISKFSAIRRKLKIAGKT